MVWRDLSPRVTRLAGRHAILIVGLTMAACVRLQASAPDLEQVRQFIINLEHDYPERPIEALVSRMDEREVRRRIIGPRSVDSDYPWLNWNNYIAPELRMKLEVLNGAPTFLVARPIRSGNERLLECGFADSHGVPVLVTLTLVGGELGLVHVADVQVAGDPFSFTTMIRQHCLLQNIPWASLLDAEEIDLHSYGETYGKQIKELFVARNKSGPDVMFQEWIRLPGNLREMRYWRYVRTQLAFSGSEKALANLQQAIRDGEDVDPFVRLRLAQEKDDYPAALSAIDDILVRNQVPVLYRCVRANLLAQSGHLAEAYDTYRDIVELTPYTTVAYLGAITAAARLQRPEQALQMMRRWTLIAAPAQIDAVIAGLPELAGLRATDGYKSWLTASPPHPALTGP
jgi:hypothetical protein